MGILTVASTVSFHARDIPSVSRPTTSRVGPVKSDSAMSRSPCSSVPTMRIGPSGRSAAQAATSRGESAWASGTEKTDPVEARTERGSNGSAPCPVVTTRSAPKASAERMSEPRFPGLPGRSKTTPRKPAPALARGRSGDGSDTTARTSGASASFSPSSAMSPWESAIRSASAASSTPRAQDESSRSPSNSRCRKSHPNRRARSIGRTPWTRNAPAWLRFFRLDRSACHCWNRAFLVVTRICLPIRPLLSARWRPILRTTGRHSGRCPEWPRTQPRTRLQLGSAHG